MSDAEIWLTISRRVDGICRVHDYVALTDDSFADVDAACEHFARRLIITGAEPKFMTGHSRHTFRKWLNEQPNKTELAELINLQEWVL